MSSEKQLIFEQGWPTLSVVVMRHPNSNLVCVCDIDVGHFHPNIENCSSSSSVERRPVELLHAMVVMMGVDAIAKIANQSLFPDNLLPKKLLENKPGSFSDYSQLFSLWLPPLCLSLFPILSLSLFLSLPLTFVQLLFYIL